MSPFEQRIVDELRADWRRARKPTPTSLLAHRFSLPHRTMLYWLNKCEAAGVICRRTPHGGWLPSGVPGPKFYPTSKRGVRTQQLPLPLFGV